MEIKGKVHCFFEQSGVFKNEFKKIGVPAEDYDIQNNFGETDHVINLFENIETAYNGGGSIFDNITSEDLIIAFFPCIYFCGASQLNVSINCINYRKLNMHERIEKILERSHNREYFFSVAVKMIGICLCKGIRIIIENPWSAGTFLKSNFIKQPDIVDIDRTRRGDVFKKPTAYWFFNCKPTRLFTEQRTPKNKIKIVKECKREKKAGICSEERSLISPDYARNFIFDFILGKKQDIGQLSLF